MLTSFRTRLPASRQRGLSLVELMVGIAVGLFVVSGAVFLVSTQLGDNRRLLLETQIQQDLRATADVIARELRRSGAEDQPVFGVWSETAVTLSPSTRGEITLTGTGVGFDYMRGDQPGPWGFRLDSDGVIRTRIGAVWQELTDKNTMNVTAFNITQQLLLDDEVLPCPRACSADLNDTSCWPRVTVRAYVIQIDAQEVGLSPQIQRSVRSEVRLRNDRVRFGATLPANQSCPS